MLFTQVHKTFPQPHSGVRP